MPRKALARTGIFFLIIPRRPRSTLFPYTTLFRSIDADAPERVLAYVTLAYFFVSTINLGVYRSEEHTSEPQSHSDLVCRLLFEKKKKTTITPTYIKKKKKQIIHNNQT